MSQAVLNPISQATESGTKWKSLYRFGAVCALTAIPVFLLDVIISFAGGDANPDTMTAIDLFALFQGNWFLGLRMLGIFNILSLAVTMPLYFALYSLHRQTHKACAALAMMLYLTGAAVYISNNAAMPMLALSGKYTLAPTEAQRSLIAAAGEAIIAKGADFTPGSLIGFLFTEIVGMAFSFMMLRGGVFGKATAISGILGFASLTVFTVCLTFFPALFNTVMVIAVVGGLSNMVWYALTARRLIKLCRE